MDERTGFNLVSIVTQSREILDARKAFKKSKEVGDKKPRLMVTDSLASYKRAFNAEFYNHHQSCKHIADVALQESLNNVLERMYRSIREREKIMRGIKGDDTPVIPMNQIYYPTFRINTPIHNIFCSPAQVTLGSSPESRSALSAD